MKFSMNGAVSIGTLDGANVEIWREVGDENFFLFGLMAEEVENIKSCGCNPLMSYKSNPELKEVIDTLASGLFSRGDRNLFMPLLDSLLRRDEYLVLEDYQSYVDCQDRVSDAFRDQQRWTTMSILNTARVGRFSSDRSVREYCANIWHTKTVTESGH